MARVPLPWRTGIAILVFALAPHPRATGGPARVEVIATPDGGIQPEAVAAADGSIDLIYFKGEPSGGDLYAARRAAGGAGFSRGIRVNSQPGSAIAVGTIRGGQVARDGEGRLHVAWNGSGSARPANPIAGTPMLYARSDRSASSFEPQRNLMTRSSQLDGGGTVAADAMGNVVVAWQARGEDATEGEAGRRFWLARSRDGGATFGPEEPAIDRPTGACACCGSRAFADSRGTQYFLFRGARDHVDRDMILLTSRDRGSHVEARTLQPWRIATCPMSSESLVEGPSGTVAAWETDGQVVFTTIDPRSLKPAPPSSPPGGGGRKHPAVAVNRRGEILLAWAEGTGWQKGGTLAWRIFDAEGRPTREAGRVERGIPVWSLPAAVARPDGGFTIIH